MKTQVFKPKVFRVIELVDGFYIQELEIIYEYYYFRLFKKVTRQWVKISTKEDYLQPMSLGFDTIIKPFAILENAKIEMERIKVLPKYHYSGTDEKDWDLEIK